MNWFLDMCIIIFYASDTKGAKSIKSKDFVNNKKDKKFFVCCYITKENMPKWIRRQHAILKIIGRKLKNPSCEIEKIEEYNLLFRQDIIILKKLLAQASCLENRQGYYEKLKKNHNLMIQRINYFLLKLIDKEVVPIKEINFELKSTLFTFLQNHSDAMTLASGIQYAQEEKEKELKILTGDKHDWNKNNLKWVFSSRPDLAKKYAIIPEIVYVQRM